MTSQREKNCGFTLIEVLVVILIFGLLMLGLNRALQLGLKAWNSQARAIAARDQLDATDRALRMLIGQMVPSSAGQQRISGQSDKLDFTTEMPAAMALATHLADASLMLDGSHFILRWTPHYHEVRTGPEPKATNSELVDGVSKLSISYYQPPDQNGSGGGWQDHWEDATMPVLFRFHIEFEKDDPRRWPDFVVAVARDQPA